MVTEVSATLVEKTILRVPLGGGSKTMACVSGAMRPYNDSTRAFLEEEDEARRCSNRCFNRRWQFSASACEATKQRMSPSSIWRWLRVRKRRDVCKHKIEANARTLKT